MNLSIISNLFTLIFNEYNSVDVEGAYEEILLLVRTHEISEINHIMNDLDATVDIREESQ